MTRRNWLYIFVLAVMAFAVCSSGGCGGSSDSSPSSNQETTPVPDTPDVVVGTFRISAGMYNGGEGTITGTNPSTFEFALKVNEDGETFSAELYEDVNCIISLTDGETTEVPLDIAGDDYVYAPEDGKDYYVSGTGDHDGEHSVGEVWKEIGVDGNGRPDFKREVYGENGWVTVLEGQLEQVSLD